jgi:hypothetical protein
MRLRPRHYAALRAAVCSPIRRVRMGEHADCTAYFNFSTVEILIRRGLLWEQAGTPNQYRITRRGMLTLNSR